MNIIEIAAEYESIPDEELDKRLDVSMDRMIDDVLMSQPEEEDPERWDAQS